MKKRLLITSIVMMLVVAVALSTATYAWFATNTSVTYTGMSIQAAAPEGSLVIAASIPDASTGTITIASGDASATSLKAATHDSTWASYSAGLVYVTNTTNVSATTGLVESGKSALTFAAVPSTGYYKDYNVYIAANGAALAAQDIDIEIDGSAVTTLPGATSIDFYYQAVTTAGTITPSNDTFVGTLNLAGLHPTTNNASETLTKVTISGTSGITIPQAGATSGNKAIQILMRVYIDGALKDSSTTTFIKNSDVVEIANQTINVKFTATDHSN